MSSGDQSFYLDEQDRSTILRLLSLADRLLVEDSNRLVPVPTRGKAQADVAENELGTFTLLKNKPDGYEESEEERDAYALCPIEQFGFVSFFWFVGEDSQGYWGALPCAMEEASGGGGGCSCGILALVERLTELTSHNDSVFDTETGQTMAEKIAEVKGLCECVTGVQCDGRELPYKIEAWFSGLEDVVVDMDQPGGNVRLPIELRYRLSQLNNKKQTFELINATRPDWGTNFGCAYKAEGDPEIDNEVPGETSEFYSDGSKWYWHIESVSTVNPADFYSHKSYPINTISVTTNTTQQVLSNGLLSWRNRNWGGFIYISNLSTNGAILVQFPAIDDAEDPSGDYPVEFLTGNPDGGPQAGPTTVEGTLHIRVVGAPPPVPPPPPPVLRRFGTFNGVDDRAEAALISAVNTKTEGTISAWVRTATTNGTLISASDTGQASNKYALGLRDGQLHVIGEVAGVVQLEGQTVARINDGWWHNVAVVVDGSGNRFYIDGQPAAVSYGTGDASSQVFFGQITGNNALTLGANRAVGGVELQLQRDLRDVQVGDAVTAAELLQLMDNGEALPNVVARYEFADLIPNTTIDDTSPNGNDATKVGSSNLIEFWNDEDEDKVDHQTWFGQYDGADDVVDYIPTGLAPGSGDFEAEFRMRRLGKPGAEEYLVSSVNNAADNFWRVSCTTSGVASFAASDGTTTATITGAKVICDNEWHFVRVVRAGISWELFVDGESQGVSGNAFGSVDSTDELLSGAGWGAGGAGNPPRFHFRGAIADLMIQGVRWYQYEQAGTVVNSEPNGNDGTLLNADELSWWQVEDRRAERITDTFGKWLGPWGTDPTRVEVENSHVLDLSGDWRLTVWFRTTLKQVQYLVRKWTGSGTTFGVFLGLDANGYIRMGYYNNVANNPKVGSRDYADGLWHKVVMEVSGNSQTATVDDGEQISESRTNADVGQTSTPIIFGGYDPLSYFEGDIANIDWRGSGREDVGLWRFRASSGTVVQNELIESRTGNLLGNDGSNFWGRV